MLTLIIGNKNYSSWSLRPWLALKHWGIPFEEIRIPLYQPESRAKLLHYSPSAKVPTLLKDGQPIWDSLAILEYLAEEFPQYGWWPEDRRARAIARSVSAEMHSGFMAVRENLPMNLRARQSCPDLPAVHQEIERIQSLWQDCRTDFGQAGAFLFGAFSIADAMYAPVVSRFVTYGVTVGPIQRAYMDAVWALPALQDWAEAAIAETETMPHYDNR